MRKLIVALAVAAAASVMPTAVDASTTSITATPSSTQAGQTVTFTASFTSSCAGALSKHYFTIDGNTVNGTLAQTGLSGTETLAISTLGVGAHAVQYNWWNGPFCRGVAGMSYTVAAVPSPSPSPSPPPSPSPLPTPSLVSVTQVATKGSDSPLSGYAGVALIVLVVAAGVGLMVASRR